MYSMDEGDAENKWMLTIYLLASAVTLQDSLIQGHLPGTVIIIKINPLTSWAQCALVISFRRLFAISLSKENSKELLNPRLNYLFPSTINTWDNVALHSIYSFNLLSDR